MASLVSHEFATKCFCYSPTTRFLLTGVVLLSDEADALFKKRSEVKDRRAPYVNSEVSYFFV